MRGTILRVIEDLSQELRSATRPQEVVRAAGAWLGAALADHGFQWVAEEDRLRRERGRRIEAIGVRNAHDNRAARKVIAELELRIWDLDLGEWRLPRYPDRVWRGGDFFANGRLEWIAGDAARPDLRDPADRVGLLTAVVAAVTDQALPWFDVMRDPESVARTAPEFAMVSYPDCILAFLASHDRPDLVTVAVDRALTRSPALRPGFDRGYRLAGEGVKPDPIKSAETLGWLTAIHGEPGYVPPADAVPPPTPLVFGAPVNVAQPLRKPDGSAARVALTGKPYGSSREAFVAHVTKFGGQPVDAVTSGAELLVVGRRPNSAHVAKAAALGVPTLPDDKFSNLWYAHDARDGERIARILAPVLGDKPTG